MTKIGLAAFTSVAALAAVTPASAAVMMCTSPSCMTQPLSNVLFTDSQNAPNVTGVLNDSRSTVVTFSATENLLTNSAGQAMVRATDGAISNSITISDGLLNALEFNLNALTGGSLTFAFAGGDSAGTVFSSTVAANGQNFFNFGGGTFTSVTIGGLSPTGTTLQDVRQVRVTAATVSPPVPEPATWAMMLVGFGAVGYSLRRKTKVNFVRTQAA